MMYTVVRFTSNSNNSDEVARIGVSMNFVRPGIYTGTRKAGDGFSCDLCSEQEWENHSSKIIEFIGEFKDAIDRMKKIGAAVTVDLAIEPEDRVSGCPLLVIGCCPEFLCALGTAGVGFEVSFYEGP